MHIYGALTDGGKQSHQKFKDLLNSFKVKRAISNEKLKNKNSFNSECWKKTESLLSKSINRYKIYLYFLPLFNTYSIYLNFEWKKEPQNALY